MIVLLTDCRSVELIHILRLSMKCVADVGEYSRDMDKERMVHNGD